MIPVSIISLFCEDLREEKSGQVTLIGIMSDNIEGHGELAKESVPAIPKLCIYTRMHFDPQDDIREVPGKMVFPNGEETTFDLFEPSVIELARRQTIAQGGPVVGVYSRVIIPNFPIIAEGRFQLIATVKERDYIAGALNIRVISPTTASAQPSSQSPLSPQPIEPPPETFRP